MRLYNYKLNRAAAKVIRAVLQESEAKLEMKIFDPPSIFVWRWVNLGDKQILLFKFHTLYEF